MARQAGFVTNLVHQRARPPSQKPRIELISHVPVVVISGRRLPGMGTGPSPAALTTSGCSSSIFSFIHAELPPRSPPCVMVMIDTPSLYVGLRAPLGVIVDLGDVAHRIP